jgi:hypothetical protein
LISDQKECQHIMMGKIGKRNRWRAISQWNAYHWVDTECHNLSIIMNVLHHQICNESGNLLLKQLWTIVSRNEKRKSLHALAFQFFQVFM